MARVHRKSFEPTSNAHHDGLGSMFIRGELTYTMNKVVLTGGAGSGKTTTIKQLNQLGYPTVPEAAIEVIQANPDLRGVDPFAFQKLVVDAQLEREAAIPTGDSGFIFLDRSLIDSMAYCWLRNVPVPNGLDKACRGSDYHTVFALETLNNFTERPETGRTSTQAVSRRTYDLLLEAYKQYGYAVVPVPDQSVEERTRLILTHLGI